MSLESSLHIRFDDFELDEKGARLIRGGQPLTLPPKAFGVLCALARRAGELLSKDALLDEVWGHQFVSESVLKTTISELRAALADDARQPRYIETAARRGYRFIAATQDGRASVPRPAVPVATPVATDTSSLMVGRRALLAKLYLAWNHAVAGKRQFFWITGEAGIGKTTLIDNFVAQLGPVLRVHGQCVEQHGAGEPYLPVLEALGTLCRNDAALVTLLRRVAPTWFLQFSWLGSEAERETLRRELSGVGQERMLREFG